MKNDARGISLITLMLSVAISAIILGAVGTLYQNLSTMRSEAALTSEAEHLVHLVQDQLNNPIVCGTALRIVLSATSDNPVTWPAPYADINDPKQFNYIEVFHQGKVTNTTDGKPPIVLAKYGDTIAAINGTASLNNGGDRITLSAMILRQPTLKEGGPVQTQVRQSYVDNGTTAFRQVNVVAAKIEFDFQTKTQLFPSNNGFLPPRSVGVTLELDPVSNKVVGCYIPSGATTQSLQCPMDTVVPCPAPSPGCSQFQYVSGFTGQGAPICSCAIACNTPPIGPPGPHKGGGGGPKTSSTTVFAPLHQRLKNATGKRNNPNASSLFSEAGLLGDITNPAVRATKNRMFAIPDGGAPTASNAEN